MHIKENFMDFEKILNLGVEKNYKLTGQIQTQVIEALAPKPLILLNDTPSANVFHKSN